MKKIYEPINGAPDKVREIMKQVLEIEKERLSELKPRGINEDIIDVIRKVIQ